MRLLFLILFLIYAPAQAATYNFTVPEGAINTLDIGADLSITTY